MQAEAILVGKRLIEQETELDGLFKERAITAVSLVRMTSQIGAARAPSRHLLCRLLLGDHAFDVRGGYRQRRLDADPGRGDGTREECVLGPETDRAAGCWPPSLSFHVPRLT
jgi:hypothetical protein